MKALGRNDGSQGAAIDDFTEAQNERALSLKGRGCGNFGAAGAKLGPVDTSTVTDSIAQIIDERPEDCALFLAIAEQAAAQEPVVLSDIYFGVPTKLLKTNSKMAATPLQQETEKEPQKMTRENACWFDDECGRVNVQDSKTVRPCPTLYDRNHRSSVGTIVGTHVNIGKKYRESR